MCQHASGVCQSHSRPVLNLREASQKYVELSLSTPPFLTLRFYKKDLTLTPNLLRISGRYSLRSGIFDTPSAWAYLFNLDSWFLQNLPECLMIQYWHRLCRLFGHFFAKSICQSWKPAPSFCFQMSKSDSTSSHTYSSSNEAMRFDKYSQSCICSLSTTLFLLVSTASSL